ncbi:MAG: hypothetical protein ACE5G8_13120 [Anaerolineae bacterium]
MADHNRKTDPSSPPGDVKSLGLIVEQEARRFFSEAQLKPDPALVAEGWNPRFIADARQTKEAVELYTELGYEVRAEPVPVEQMGDECSDCQVLVLLQFKTIYTRKK